MWEIFDKLTGLAGSLVLAGLGLRFMAKASWKKVGIVLSGIGLFWLGGEMIKLGVAAPRPCWNPATPSLVSCPESFSFPSGHALAAAMAATVVVLVTRSGSCQSSPPANTPKGSLRGGPPTTATPLAINRFMILVLGVAWVILVAMTRLLAGIHTWVDVLGGVVLGAAFGWLTWRWYWQ